MWVILLVGNIIRGIGEATLVPLGISFIDDYARPENSAFYIGDKIIVGFLSHQTTQGHQVDHARICFKN